MDKIQKEANAGHIKEGLSFLSVARTALLLLIIFCSHYSYLKINGSLLIICAQSFLCQNLHFLLVSHCFSDNSYVTYSAHPQDYQDPVALTNESFKTKSYLNLIDPA